MAETETATKTKSKTGSEIEALQKQVSELQSLVLTLANQAQQAPAKQGIEEKDPYPGMPWHPGSPVPEGFFVIQWQGGAYTLEKRAPDGFDAMLRTKILKEIDAAFTRGFENPSERFPRGRQPHRMLVNVGFRQLFPNVMAWGDLNPTCHIETVRECDEFNHPAAVKVGDVRVYFVLGDKTVEV